MCCDGVGGAMPRYFFHVEDGRDLDVEGLEMPDFDSARKEAIRFAGCQIEMAADHLVIGELWSMEVCDEFGARCMALAFSIAAGPASPDRSGASA